MVRFNDKTQISSLANNDIMPITDMSDSTDDKKVTIQQLTEYINNTIPSNKFANLDLSNLSTTGQAILDSKLDQTQITNCILEIPQNIKFKLTNGVLKIKSGSKVYIPNGVNKFDVETISNDITVSLSTGTGTYRVFYRKGGNAAYANQSNVKSGSTPTSNIQGMYYDTTLNKISFYNNNTTGDGSLYTFPLAEITITNGKCTSINQIFNGIGYIGSTVFVLPNVKGLFPNGRNADGTLKNIETTFNAVKLFTFRNLVNINNQDFVISNTGGMGNGDIIDLDYIPSYRKATWLLLRPENIIYEWNLNNNSYLVKSTSVIKIANVSVANGVITTFKANYPFRAVDFNDFYELQENALNKTQITNCILEAPNGVATYSGSIITIKSGLKVLIPNGRNADDTLKNIEYTISSDVTINSSTTYPNKTYDFALIYQKDGNYVHLSQNYKETSAIPKKTGSHQYYYNSNESIMYYNNAGQTWDKKEAVKLGIGRMENGVITSLTPYEPFRAMDYNDFINNGISNVICTTAPTTTSTASAQTPAVVVENYVNGTSGYRVWSDGYCEQWGRYGAFDNDALITVSLLKNYNNTNYLMFNTYLGLDTHSSAYPAGGAYETIANRTSSSFVLNTNGGIDPYNTSGIMWKTSGYIK